MLGVEMKSILTYLGRLARQVAARLVIHALAADGNIMEFAGGDLSNQLSTSLLDHSTKNI